MQQKPDRHRLLGHRMRAAKHAGRLHEGGFLPGLDKRHHDQERSSRASAISGHCREPNFAPSEQLATTTRGELKRD